MTLYTEIDWANARGGIVTAVEGESAARAMGVEVGDELLGINGHPVEDVIDVQYYGADEALSLLVRRNGETVRLRGARDYGQMLGLSFAHPTFDTDIRRCNNLCEFCFVLQMAPKFRRTLYIKDDDYRYSFLFGHYVTLTNLDDHDWWRIETMRLSPLYISVHATDNDLRRRFLRNDAAPDILAQLRWLAERDIEMHTQLVIVPGFNDGVWLERSIGDLAELYPAVQSVSVVPVGLTKQHKYGMRPHTAEEAATMLDAVAAFQPAFQERFGYRFVYPTDEWFLVAGRSVPESAYYDDQQLHENGLGVVRRFLDEWVEVQAEIHVWQVGRSDEAPDSLPRRITLVTGALFAGTLTIAGQRLAELTGIDVAVVAISNERLGETITAAGLLMAEDVLAQLAGQKLGELVVLPRVMFDHPDVIALDDLSPANVADQLGQPVALADTMGDVWDALTGASSVVFRPGGA
jgi:putative radical SAM enzyme (TIGR03279 family)